ncbi:phosphotransferase [Nonomuraea soli]|uniref:Glucosamine kinase n=1 Tax=Nonomuraea soli TaxID=1032476 RepID=A0A7W0CLI7_9ACTN|nr:phosphotransferase [Nonomuraea soli]MBA2893249.1 maltokinase [Nonomuraea soli]
MLAVGENPITTSEHGLSSALLAALSGEVPAPFAVERFAPLPAAGPSERAITVDQTNLSVVVDERVVVKWLTPPAALPHPAPAVLGHLVRAGFTDTAPPYAAVTTDSHLVALVTGFLPGARDGWEWCIDFCETGEVTFAGRLGTLAADLHVALATLPSPTPAAPMRAPEPERAAARAEQALSEALRLTEGEDGEWLASVAHRMKADLAMPGRVTGPIRIHGDFHVGQILQWDGGYAVIDFDGNPTLDGAEPYQPRERDVAQMTTSLEHVAQVAIKRRQTPTGRAHAWAAEAREQFLAAYRERLPLDESLLKPYEVEQECRELIYAARHLPRWRYAPMGVLKGRY